MVESSVGKLLTAEGLRRSESRLPHPGTSGARCSVDIEYET
jgi:hypothetical protein